MADRLGQQFGNYRLVRLLGYGGFAEVYLGEHIHLQTQAAIKVLSTQLVAKDLERFTREARTIAALEHAHIVRVFDFGIENDIPFLVMSYAPNGTLRQRHPKESKVALTDVLTYVSPIASALQYAHDRKIIHRDVKPENMLLGNQNEVLLSDFGIAISTSTSTSRQTKTTAGTAAYMSPEQIMGQPDIASDQYALGIIVYEWLSGDQPFHGSFFEMCAQHLHAPISSLREKNPEIPAEIEQCILRALTKQPAQRFARIQDFATALQESYQLASQTNVITLQRSPAPPHNSPSVSNEATRVKNTSGDRSTYVNSSANDPTFVRPAPSHASAPGVTGSDDSTFVKDAPYLSQSAGSLSNRMEHMGDMSTAIWAASTRLLASSPVQPSVSAIDQTKKNKAKRRKVLIAVALPALLLLLISIPFLIPWLSGLASTNAQEAVPTRHETSVPGQITTPRQQSPGASTQQYIGTSTQQPVNTPTQSSGQTSPTKGVTPTPKSNPSPTPTATPRPPTATPLPPTPTATPPYPIIP